MKILDLKASQFSTSKKPALTSSQLLNDSAQTKSHNTQTLNYYSSAGLSKSPRISF